MARRDADRSESRDRERPQVEQAEDEIERLSAAALDREWQWSQDDRRNRRDK